jgi:alkylated DNA repair dioxygenase AlkB
MSRAIVCSAAADPRTAGAARGSPNLLPCDGAVFLYPDALPQAAADRLFAELRGAIEWRQEVASLMGRRVAIPRLTAWHGAAGYVYSGIRLTPAPWTPPLLELKALAEALAGQPFDSVLLNLYRDGRDSVSWHADNEPGLGRDPVIASLSLGAVRRFQLRHRRGPAARLLPDHGRRHPAPLAAPAAQDRPPGRPADQPHLSADGLTVPRRRRQTRLSPRAPAGVDQEEIAVYGS